MGSPAATRLTMRYMWHRAVYVWTAACSVLCIKTQITRSSLIRVCPGLTENADGAGSDAQPHPSMLSRSFTR